MSSSPASEDESTWRRRFAARANNRAWTLSEQVSRTPEENQEMLHAAHAAMYLWSAIGTERHWASAQLLLGQVHALLGDARHALPYAQTAHDYFKANSSEPMQLAISHAILANAAHCAGNTALYETNYAAATALGAEVANTQAKEIFAATMNRVPKPMGSASNEAV